MTGFMFCHFSSVDTCKICAECGKGLEFGTNEAFVMYIKTWLGGISKIIKLVFRQYGCFKHRYSTEGEKFKKMVCLHSKTEVTREKNS